MADSCPKTSDTGNSNPWEPQSRTDDMCGSLNNTFLHLGSHTSHRLTRDLWLTKDNRFLNLMSSY